MEIEQKKKLNVLFILHLPPPVHGAAIANTYIKNSNIINTDYHTDYISLATNTVLAETGKGSFKKIFKFFSIVWQVVSMLNVKKYDLCYLSLTANGPAFYKDLIIVALLKLARKKIIYHFHNKGVALAKQTMLNDSLYRFAFKNTKLILLSKYLYGDVAKFVSEKQIYYCPYGIPTSVLTGHTAKKFNSSVIKLLYLSNMMIEKGVYVLLEACVMLKNRNISFTCDFVGGWTDINPTEFNEYVIANGLTDQVFAHGPKYGEEKLAFFDKADVFIFPTYYHYETFGLVNLEAMQHALPIISTTEGGIPDVISDGETGFLIPKKDSMALAEKIAYLANNPEQATQMGKLGKAKFEKYFTINTFEKNISEIIHKAYTSLVQN